MKLITFLLLISFFTATLADECLQDSDCNGHANGPFCDPDIKMCVSCLSDDDCTNGYCDVDFPSAMDNVCVECDPISNKPCKDGKHCKLSEAGGKLKYVCDSDLNECSTDADCDGTLICKEDHDGYNVCQCRHNADCIHPQQCQFAGHWSRKKCMRLSGKIEESFRQTCVHDNDCLLQGPNYHQANRYCLRGVCQSVEINRCSFIFYYSSDSVHGLKPNLKVGIGDFEYDNGLWIGSGDKSSIMDHYTYKCGSLLYVRDILGSVEYVGDAALGVIRDSKELCENRGCMWDPNGKEYLEPPYDITQDSQPFSYKCTPAITEKQTEGAPLQDTDNFYVDKDLCQRLGGSEFREVSWAEGPSGCVYNRIDPNNIWYEWVTRTGYNPIECNNEQMCVTKALDYPIPPQFYNLRQDTGFPTYNAKDCSTKLTLFGKWTDDDYWGTTRMHVRYNGMQVSPPEGFLNDQYNTPKVIDMECHGDSDCWTEQPYCKEFAFNHCVECLEDSHCEHGCRDDNTCEMCTEDAHCIGHPDGAACESIKKICIPCRSDTHCHQSHSIYHRCELDSRGEEFNTCIECNEDQDCVDSGNPNKYCQDKVCVECTSEAGCEEKDDDPNTSQKGRCKTQGGIYKCVECYSDWTTNFCADNKNFCSSDDRCAECLQDTDCESMLCDMETLECKLCTTTEDCNTGNCLNGICSTSECLVDADCGSDKPFCLPGSNNDNKCVECLQHSACTDIQQPFFDALKPYCSSENTCTSCEFKYWYTDDPSSSIYWSIDADPPNTAIKAYDDRACKESSPCFFYPKTCGTDLIVYKTNGGGKYSYFDFAFQPTYTSIGQLEIYVKDHWAILDSNANYKHKILCDTNDQCNDNYPTDGYCNEGVCGICSADSHCTDNKRCNEGRCVSCTDDSECSDVCNPVTGTCVECVNDDHCTNGFCGNNVCAECHNNNHCNGNPDGEFCDVKRNIGDNVCVGCTYTHQCRSKFPGTTCFYSSSNDYYGFCAECKDSTYSCENLYPGIDTNDLVCADNTCKCNDQDHEFVDTGEKFECLHKNRCNSTHHTCQNGGTIVGETTSGCSCSCPPKFTGTHCEQEVPCNANDIVCENGGTAAGTLFAGCSCTCADGYSGDNCEYRSCNVDGDCLADEGCYNNQCKIQCTDKSDCPVHQSRCVDNFCQPCSEDSHCLGHRDAPVCIDSVCTRCIRDGDGCAVCSGNEDCTGYQQYCEDFKCKALHHWEYGRQCTADTGINCNYGFLVGKKDGQGKTDGCTCNCLFGVSGENCDFLGVCDSNSDCPADRPICQNNICGPCSVDSDCSERSLEQVCSNSQCVNCIPNNNGEGCAECASNTDCEFGKYCKNRECVILMDVDTPCRDTGIPIPAVPNTFNKYDGDSPDGEGPDKAMDGNINSKLLINLNGRGQDGFMVTTTSGTVIRIKLTSANDAEGRDPTSITLYGSKSFYQPSKFHTDWRIIGYVENIRFDNRLETKEFDIDFNSVPTEYKHYKIMFTERYNYYSTMVQIAEIELIEDAPGSICNTGFLSGINDDCQCNCLFGTTGDYCEELTVLPYICANGIAADGVSSPEQNKCVSCSPGYYLNGDNCEEHTKCGVGYGTVNYDSNSDLDTQCEECTPQPKFNDQIDYSPCGDHTGCESTHYYTYSQSSDVCTPCQTGSTAVDAFATSCTPIPCTSADCNGQTASGDLINGCVCTCDENHKGDTCQTDKTCIDDFECTGLITGDWGSCVCTENVDCVGSWGGGSCSFKKKIETYTISLPKYGTGQACPHADGDTQQVDCECPEGTHSDACCTSDQFVVAGWMCWDKTTSCPEGYKLELSNSNTEDNTCVLLCPPGSQLQGDSCVECPPLTYGSSGTCSNKKPEGCVKGKGLYEGSSKTSDDSECVACNTDTTNSALVSDTSNTFNPTDGSRAPCIQKKTWLDCTDLTDAECAQINCAEGYSLHPGDTQTDATCQKCPAGTFSLVSDQECTECPVGQYQPSEGQGACTKCPVGKSGQENPIDPPIEFDGNVYRVCKDDTVSVKWNGNHNIYEVDDVLYKNYDGSFDQTNQKHPFEGPGTELSVSGLGADAGTTRYFICTRHPEKKFRTTCLSSTGNTQDSVDTQVKYVEVSKDKCDNAAEALASKVDKDHADSVLGEMCSRAIPNNFANLNLNCIDLHNRKADPWIGQSHNYPCLISGCQYYVNTMYPSSSAFGFNEETTDSGSYKDYNTGTCTGWLKPAISYRVCKREDADEYIVLTDPTSTCDNPSGSRRRLRRSRPRRKRLRSSAPRTSEENSCFTCDAGSYSDVEGATQCTLCQSGTFQKDSGMSKCDDLRTCSSKQHSSNEALATVSGSTIDRLCDQCKLSEYTIANGAYTNDLCDSGSDCPHTCDTHYTPNTASCLEGTLVQGTCTDVDECAEGNVDCGEGDCDGSVPTPNIFNLGYSCICYPGYSQGNTEKCTQPSQNTIEFNPNLKRSHYRQSGRNEIDDNRMELCQGDSYYLRMISGTTQLKGPSIDTSIENKPKELIFLEGDYVLESGSKKYDIRVESCGVVKAKELSVRKNIREMKEDFVGVSRADVAKVDQDGDSLFFKLQFRNLREMIQKSNILIKHGGKPQKKNRAGETFASKVLNQATEKDNKLLRKFFKTSTLGKRKKPLSQYSGISLNAQSSEADYEAAEEAIALVEGVHKTQVFVHRIQSRRRRLLQDDGVDIFDDCNPNDADCECNGYLLNGECTLYSVCLEDEYIKVWGGDQDHTCAPKESCPLGKGVISEAVDATSSSVSIPTQCFTCDGITTYSDQETFTLLTVPTFCDTSAECIGDCVNGECVLKQNGESCSSDQECLGYCGNEYTCRDYVVDTGCKEILVCTQHETYLVEPSTTQNSQCQCKWGYRRLSQDGECISCHENSLSGGRCNCPDNHYSLNLECHPCQGTSVNTNNVNPVISGDTRDSCKCLAGTRVTTQGDSNTCVPCPSGYTSVESSVFVQNICIEDPNLCKVNEYVSFGRCVSCPPGTTNRKGDDKNGPNTECDDDLCFSNQRVALINGEYVCLQCPANSFAHSGDDPSNRFETSCCPINTYETVVADIYYPNNQVCSTDDDCEFAQKCISGLCAQAIDRQCTPCGTNSETILQTYEDLDCCLNVGSQVCQRLKIDKDLHCEASC